MTMSPRPPRLEYYNGYTMSVRRGETAVFDPRYPTDPAVYHGTSLAAAKRWVNAYRAGQQWASDARR